MSLLIFTDDYNGPTLWQCDGDITSEDWGKYLREHAKRLVEFQRELACEMFPEVRDMEERHYNIVCPDYWERVKAFPNVGDEFRALHMMAKVPIEILYE